MNTNDKRRRHRTSRPASPAPEKTPEVSYTQPKPFSKQKLILRLVSVAAVALALIFGLSIFFKVENVEVSGNVRYTEWDVREASGVQDGENLLTLSHASIGAKVLTKLPYLATARVGIRLPNTLIIEVTELDVVYAAEAKDGSWWLLSADGKIVDKSNSGDAGEHTKLLGIQLDNPQIGEQAVAAEPDTTQEGSTETPVTVYARERLAALLTIIQNLERWRILGLAATIDVSDMGRIILWYGKQYEVNLGDANNLPYKIEAMKGAIDSMSPYQRGHLDVSFTTWQNQVGYSQFKES